MRQIGFGDMVVGKHVGRMMGMLGGRLGAYREGIARGTLDAALVRNLYRGEAPDPGAVAHVRRELLALHAGYLRDSYAYVDAVADDVRFFCLFPLKMAEATISQAREDLTWLRTGSTFKVSRAHVAAIVSSL